MTLVELTNPKAAKLLYELEELHLIKVLKTEAKDKQKLSEKYAGKLPANIADELKQYVMKSRNEMEQPQYLIDTNAIINSRVRNYLQKV